jgi:hypothetical protein
MQPARRPGEEGVSAAQALLAILVAAAVALVVAAAVGRMS